MSSILYLTVADEPDTWAKLGFTLDGRTVRIGSTAITMTGASETERNITGWVLADETELPEQIDGIRTTTTVSPTTAPPPAPAHPNGITGIDHIVINTPNLPRTIEAFEDLGWECRRTREAGAYGQQKMRQAFFWFGDVIIEVVGPQDIDPAKADQPATFFGLALTSDDLDATVAFMGDLMKPPIEAVQPGRRISTISSRCGSTVPIAVMSPHPKASS